MRVDTRLNRVYVAAGIVLLSLSHWLISTPDKQLNNLLYNLNFIPILAAGMLFGAPMAMFATALTLAAEIPHLWTVFANDPSYRMDQIGETLASGVGGVVVGLLASRDRMHRQRLEETSHELAQVNHELRDSIERLRKAERMSAVAQLSATVAHEIRNPLASISGAAGILKRGNAKPEHMEECLSVIEKESTRLNRLLTNFLTFARPRTLRLQPTDLTELIDSTIALARHSGNTGDIEFERHIEGDIPEVRCDSEQVKQVLLNLAMNAVQATGKGVIRFRAWARDGSAFIAVEDQGPGIPKELEHRIFEPFFTTRVDGTGLGLAIAGNIIEQHSGRITPQNEPGQGLTMILELPVSPGVV